MKLIVMKSLLLMSIITLSMLSAAVKAAPILSFEITSSSMNAEPGEIVTYSGVITNRTGSTLESTDMFFDFFNFDFDALFPVQILGTTPFTLPHLTFSPVTELFAVEILPDAVDGTMPTIDFALLDFFGNISDPGFVTINVMASGPGPVAMPVTGTFFLVLSGCFVLVWIRRRERWGICNMAIHT